MENIEVTVAGSFERARSRGLEERLAVTVKDGYASFVVPRLEEYEVVVLE
jgi:hypothetical protein